jgi:hypothetical protein
MARTNYLYLHGYFGLCRGDSLPKIREPRPTCAGSSVHHTLRPEEPVHAKRREGVPLNYLVATPSADLGLMSED